MTFPPLADFLGALSPGSQAILMAGALLGGLVRGFTGFGFAMVFVPIATMAIAPVAAIGLVWFVDAPFALPLAAKSAGKAEWREVIPLLVGATALLPLGVFLLTYLDPVAVRWLTAVTILCAVAALASGWRYRGRPTMPLSVAVGAASGLASGFAGLGGMPLAIFWLGGHHTDIRQMRHNLMAYFALSSFVSGAVLAWNGVLTLAIMRQAILLLIPYGLGILVGARAFHLASEALFRRAGYAIIAAAAVLALPLFDRWLRG